MANDVSRLFVPPTPYNPPNVQVDFYRMLSGIGDAYVASRERRRQEGLRDTFKEGVPTRQDGAIDYAAISKSLGERGADVDTVLKAAGLSETQRTKDEELKQWNDFARAFGGGNQPPAAASGEKPVTFSTGPSPAVASAPGRVYRQDEFTPLDAQAPPMGSMPATAETLARPKVASTSRVVGDDEAVARGYYDPPKATAAPTVGAPAPGIPTAQPTNPVSGNIPALIAASVHPRAGAAQREMAKVMLTKALDDSKLTDEQKEYLWARAQSDPANRMSFTEWKIALKKAGAPPEAEKEEEKGIGKGAAERFNATMTAASAGPKTLQSLNQVGTLLNRLEQGKIQPARMTISAWAKSLGVDDSVAASIGLDPKSVGDAQAVQALIAQSVIGKIGAGGFPANNFSDADRAFLERTVPSLANDPRGNKVIMEVARRVAQLDIEKGKAALQYRRDPANKGKSHDDFEVAWAQSALRRDLFGDLRREAEGIAGPSQAGGPSRADVEAELRRRGVQ